MVLQHSICKAQIGDDVNNEKLVQAQLVAYNNRDIDAFCACYHPEVKIKNALSDKIACEGMEQFREIYRNLFKDSPELLCKLKSRIVLEESVIDEEFVTGISKFKDGLHTVAIYGFRDGLIDRVLFPK